MQLEIMRQNTRKQGQCMHTHIHTHAHIHTQLQTLAKESSVSLHTDFKSMSGITLSSGRTSRKYSYKLFLELTQV